MDRGAILLVAVVLLAGCGGSTGSSQPATPTVTPAPVPVETATTTATPDRLAAPGLGPTGVVDPGQLVEAHAEFLATHSFTAYVNSSRRLPDGTLESRYIRRLQFEADKDHFYYVLNQYDRGDRGITNRTIERWAAGQVVLQSTIEDGERSSRIIRMADPSRSFPENASNRVDLYRLFTRMDTAVTDVFERNGTIEYRLRGGPQSVPPLRNVTIAAVVTEQGLIRQYRVAYTVGPDQMRVVVDAKYLRLGRTDVPVPTWVTEID